MQLMYIITQVTHQVFRRSETYSFLIHATLLLGPPALLVTYSSTLNVDAMLAAVTQHVGRVVLLIVLYRLSPFHPLARYPGPIAYRLSMLVPAFSSMTGKRAKYYRALHKRYGDIVRIGTHQTLSWVYGIRLTELTGPNELSISNPSFIPPLLGSSGLPKGPCKRPPRA